MDNIKEKYINVEINLGFIGYKDVDEINNNENGCLIIKFTKQKERRN